MCKTKATVTLFVSLLNMCICVSDVTLSMPCHRMRARVITIMLEILWRVTNYVWWQVIRSYVKWGMASFRCYGNSDLGEMYPI